MIGDSFEEFLGMLLKEFESENCKFTSGKDNGYDDLEFDEYHQEYVVWKNGMHFFDGLKEFCTASKKI